MLAIYLIFDVVIIINITLTTTLASPSSVLGTVDGQVEWEARSSLDRGCRTQKVSESIKQLLIAGED